MAKVVFLNKKKLEELPIEPLCNEDVTVTEIHACFNFLSKIALNTPLVNGLTVLSLSCNELTEIPGLNDDKSVCGIRELYLANNKITVMDNLTHYPNLRILDLRKNKIRVLEEIGDKKNLKRLSLSCNEIRSVNFKNLIVLPELEFLGLFDNLIDTSFPLTQLLCCTPHLYHLYVGCNPLSKGKVLSLSNIILDQAKQHINTTAYINKHTLLRSNDLWHTINIIVSNCPSIQMVDGYYIIKPYHIT